VKRIVLLAGVAIIAASCSEKVNSGGTCPALCPEQSLPLQETELDAVAFDTTVGPFPVRGTEIGLLLASRPDTLDVRGVMRFDSLPRTYLRNAADVDITAVDSARIFVRVDTSVVHFSGEAAIEVYDVDTTASDTSEAVVASLFRPDRLIVTRPISSLYFLLDDTLSISIPNAFLLDKIQQGKPLRLGYRFAGTGDITLLSVESGLPAVLRFDPAPGDTTVASRVIGLLSLTPRDDLLVANDFRDFSVVLRGTPPPTERLAAGGLPAYRTYLRLAVPSFFLDSVVIVRAQLQLVQRPTESFDGEDATIFPVVGSAGETVTDIRRAAQLVHPLFSYSVLPLTAAPGDSGVRSIDLVQVFRQWSFESASKNKPVTAIILRSGLEGRGTGRLAFFGLDAAPNLRPRLRLTYVARTRFGLP
jgi:hypothetical protein